MKTNVLRSVAILAAFGAFTNAAMGQETTNRVAAKTDWSVFVESNPKECWGVVAPKKTVNTKGGKEVQVRRSDILFFITFRPGAAGEVMFMGGYPFADGSTVELEVNTGAKFTLFTAGEGAWAAPGEDAKVISALKAGGEVTLTGRSGKGTQTKDTFSLMGFTAAMDEAANRCK